jgi:hypothetical protein
MWQLKLSVGRNERKRGTRSCFLLIGGHLHKIITLKHPNWNLDLVSLCERTSVKVHEITREKMWPQILSCRSRVTTDFVMTKQMMKASDVSAVCVTNPSSWLNEKLWNKSSMGWRRWSSPWFAVKGFDLSVSPQIPYMLSLFSLSCRCYWVLVMPHTFGKRSEKEIKCSHRRMKIT